MKAIEIKHKVNMEMGLGQISKDDQEGLEYYKDLLLKINLLHEILGFTININHTKTDGGYYALITLDGNLNEDQQMTLTRKITEEEDDFIGVHCLNSYLTKQTILILEINF